MKLLILGGTGAMGASLVPILVNRGDDVYVTSRRQRISAQENLHYIQGDAHDPAFLKRLLNERYDAIVDFMVYSTNQFTGRRDLLLDAAGQYIFLSSSRVYANSEEPLTEKSPRLLDVTKDEAYLQTDEYALAKARQEDALSASGRENWTIVRPYITYSNARLQLGVYEKEIWLFRALRGKTIVFPKDIASKQTTLTMGENVAEGIAYLIGNREAYGKAFHIAAKEAICWEEVLDLYRKVIKEVTGLEMKVKYTDTSEEIYELWGSRYQMAYDRCFDRRFDNSEIMRLTEQKLQFVSPREGLEKCLREFLQDPVFLPISWRGIITMDKLAKERISLPKEMARKEKLYFALYRYMPKKLWDLAERMRR